MKIHIQNMIYNKKYVQRLWRIYDFLFLNKERAEDVEDGKELEKQVFVGIDENTEYNLSGESAEFFKSCYRNLFKIYMCVYLVVARLSCPNNS